jgi:type I restriction enzyme, S subunit
MTNWRTKQIRNLGRVVTGKTPPKIEPHYFDGDELFVFPKDLDWDQLYVTETETRVSSKALEKFKNQVIPKNSVMFTSLSFGFGKMGIASRALLTNQQINSVVVNKENDFRFVFYLLKACTPFIFACNSGIDTPIVPKSVFERIELSCPEFRWQNKIAAVLWAYDELIENNKRRIALLEKMTEEIYREWFVRFRFADHEKVKFVKGIPLDWRPMLIGDLLKRIPSGKKYEQKTAAASGKVPILDQGQSGIIGYHDSEPGVLASAEKPVIVFANHTCYQRLIFFPFSAIQNVLPFVPSTTTRSNIFWLHMATNRAVELSEYKGHWPAFVTKRIYYPGFELTQLFGDIVAPFFKQKFQIENANEVLRKLRDLTLPRLISGKLSVENLDIQFPPGMAEESEPEPTASLHA